MKRLFFGFVVVSSWSLPPNQEKSPKILEDRHLTVAFLGNIEEELILKLLPKLPLPSFKVGLTGFFDKCLLFPHVIALHAHFFQNEKIFDFQKNLSLFLEKMGFKIDDRAFVPHVSVCRDPLAPDAWQKSFCEQPFFIQSFHLFESLGNSKYKSLWNYPLLPAFEEIEHTADIAYKVFGENLETLYLNALIALTFYYSPLLKYVNKKEKIESLQQVISLLNELIFKADAEMGCPLKAISFHGQIKEENNILSWEMIVDV